MIDFSKRSFTTKTLLKLKLHSQKSIFLTGSGGSGKSFLVKELRGMYKSSLMLGSTNQSANLIGGQTVQSFFKLYDSKTVSQLNSREQNRIKKLKEKYPLLKEDALKSVLYSKERKILLKTQLLVVDEVSMLSKSVFNLMMYQLKKIAPDRFYEIEILLVGDFYQLQPVHGEHSFKSSYFQDFQTIELKEVKRTSSKTFIEVLSSLRVGEVTQKAREVLNFFSNNYKAIERKEGGLKDLEDRAVFLYSTNQEVNFHNSRKMEELEGTELLEECDIAYRDRDLNNWDVESFIRDSQFEEKFYFKLGARVIFIANDTLEKSYYNGLQGTIIGFNKSDNFEYVIKVKTEEDKILEVKKASFQKINYVIEGGRVRAKIVLEINQLPLKLAYSITVHKSQGKSISGDVVIDATRIFKPHQFYVALSRAVEPKKVFIRGLNLNKHIRVDPEVKRFYRSLGDLEEWKGY